MRILYLLASNSYSGAENVVCTIIDNLGKGYKGYYCSPNGPIKEILENRKIDFIETNFTIKSLKKIIKKYKIDIIHAHDLKASFLAYFVSNEVRVISHLHGGYPFYKTVNLYTLTYAFIQRKFKKIFVVSNEILAMYKFKNLIKDKTIVLENKLDPKYIKKQSLTFETKKYDVLFVGRIIDIKRPIFYLEIIKKLRKKHFNIRTAMAGNGPLYDKCIEYIKENNLEENVDMLGFVKNSYPYIKNSKLLVMPSEFEGLPMTTIEALILEKPVVNSGVGGLSDLFKDNKELICKNIDEYVDEIEKILYNEKKYNTRKIVKDYIDINNYMKKIIDVYEDSMP